MKIHLVMIAAIATLCFGQEKPAPNTEDGKLETIGSQQGANAARPYANKLPEGPTPRTADGHPDLSGNWAPNAIRQNVDLVGSGVDVPMLPGPKAIWEKRKASL